MACNECRPINRNYVGFNFRIMQLLGIWNPYRTGFSLWMYRLYTGITFTSIVFVYTSLEIVDAMIVSDDLQFFTENICLTMTHLAGIVKIVNLWMKRAKIDRVVDILEQELRQKDGGAIGMFQEKMIGSAISRGTILTKIFGGLIGFTAVAGMMYPFWDQSYKVWKFPYRCYFPMQTNSSAIYWSSFAYIGFSVTGQAYIILSHDTLFVVFMIHLVAQIKILKIKVEALYIRKGFGHSGTNFQLKINDEDLDGFDDSIGVSNSKWWIMELNSCIKYHQGILRLVSELESIFSNVILLQFATSLIIIGLTGFQVTVSASSGRFLPMAGYLCCILLELLLYCWYGNEIIIESENLKTSAYASSWYRTGDLKFCKTLSILMARTQKPLVVTAGNFCDLSLETFVVILSRSYSYMAVLNQLNE